YASRPGPEGGAERNEGARATSASIAGHASDAAESGLCPCVIIHSPPEGGGLVAAAGFGREVFGRGFLELTGTRRGDVVAQLHVAFVAGVLEELVLVVARPIEAGGERCLEDFGVGVGHLVDDRVRSGHGQPLDDLRLRAGGDRVPRRHAHGRHVERRTVTGERVSGGAIAGLQVGGLNDQRVAFPAAAAAAEPRFDRFRPRLELTSDRNYARAEHFQRDRHVAGGLVHANAVVVAERQHRSREAAGDAAVPSVEVGDPVELGVGRPARTAGAVQRFGFRREGGKLTTGRLDQQRSAATGRVGLDPVAHADAARAVFGVVSLSRTLSLLFALRHFFF